MNGKRVVLDTNILVSALMSKHGNPAKILNMFLSGALVLIYCDEVLDEYEDVLYRPRLHIPANDADIVMAAVQQHGEKVLPAPSTNPMPDEDDRVFYDVAKSAVAYLITGNTKHYPNEPFILTPTEFLEMQSENN